MSNITKTVRGTMNCSTLDPLSVINEEAIYIAIGVILGYTIVPTKSAHV